MHIRKFNTTSIGRTYWMQFEARARLATKLYYLYRLARMRDESYYFNLVRTKTIYGLLTHIQHGSKRAKQRKNAPIRTSDSKGFTLVEMLIVISIIALLAGVLFANLDSAQQKAQDAKRIADVKQLEVALRLYYDRNHAYPEETTVEGSQSSWEVSFIPNFMEYLDQYVPTRIPKDPINSGPPTDNFATRPDGSFYYAYFKYGMDNGGGKAYGCAWDGPFAVLAFRSLERLPTNRIPLSRAHCGPWPCTGGPYPGYNPPTCRDWGTEFDYSVFLVD